MNKNLIIFLLAYLNVHYLLLLFTVHEYAYFYEYIWKIVCYRPPTVAQPGNAQSKQQAYVPRVETCVRVAERRA